MAMWHAHRSAGSVRHRGSRQAITLVVATVTVALGTGAQPIRVNDLLDEALSARRDPPLVDRARQILTPGEREWRTAQERMLGWGCLSMPTWHAI